ncbi:MAG: bifunctional glutamate N-acetyltransferase/amino-acid acetyltransferase ArgJ, partial [Phycisphaerae bacterium]|nr:bifunctional glutamate N-acetyltransferase/amino-acid acetyltransferase ArgJ [Phycisphaerae bacterium]
MAGISILTPKGFRAAGVSAGIKTKRGALDVGALVCERPATAAALFTTNKVVGAPVTVSREAIRGGKLRALIVNSGNSNACTGRRGLQDARRMTRLCANALGISAGEVLVASTGIIGVPMPMKKIAEGIQAACSKVSASAKAADDFAASILTTDLRKKVAGRQFLLGKKKITIAGVAKGSGMIAPNMATMLAFLTTDADITAKALQGARKTAADESFNALTVDGHTSTSDTVAIMASGLAENTRMKPGSAGAKKFAKALGEVCRDLAYQIVADAEGGTKVIEVRVSGAASPEDAKKAARAIADSPLVKCAFNGEDPNWGRIVSAAGYSGAALDPARVDLEVNGHLLYRHGSPATFDAETVSESIRAERETSIVLRVGDGPA